MKLITYEQLREDVELLAKKIVDNMAGHDIYDNIYAVPRGGVYIGAILAEIMGLELVDDDSDLGPFTLVVDDLIDSGKTRKKYWGQDFAVLYNKNVIRDVIPTYYVRDENEWLVFPWENTDADVEDNIVRLLQFNNKTVTDTNIEKVKTYLEGLDD